MMSLTTELKNPDSPISVWMRENMKPSAVQLIVDGFNKVLSRKSAIVVEGADPALVGTAFDYAFRWRKADLDPYSLVAMHGAVLADRAFKSKYGHSAGEATVTQIVELGNRRQESWAKCCVVLAWFEGVFRGLRFLETIEACYQSRDPQTLLGAVSRSDELDIQRLSATIPLTWGEKLDGRYIPNPTFAGSADVGGADADWVIGNTLYDCKTSRKRQPFDIQHFLQIVGYVLLDYDNQYDIQQVGWYFARQQAILEMPINRIFRDLGKSRESLRKCLSERVIS